MVEITPRRFEKRQEILGRTKCSIHPFESRENGPKEVVIGKVEVLD